MLNLQKLHHFQVETLTDGVYAAIGNGGSNAGIVDLGGETLVFDTFTTLLRQLELLGPKTIVPGHRGVISAEYGFSWARKYLNYVFHLVESFDGTLSIDEDFLQQIHVLDGCRPGSFRENLLFLIAQKQE